MSFGFGFGFPRGGSAGAWSPFSLFAGGVQGAYYDPSYLNTYMSGRGPELITGAASAYSGNGTVATVGDTVTATCTTNGIYGITWVSTSIISKQVFCTFEVVSNSAPRSMLFFPNANTTASVVGTTTGVKTFNVFAAFATGASQPRPIFYIDGLVGESFSVRLVSIKEVTTIGNATMFTTSTGTTPVTAVEQNVGLILDQSQGLVLGSERVGPTWSIADPSWSQSGSDLIAVNGVNFGVSQPIATIGVWCKFTFEVYNYASGTLNVRTGSTNGITMSATANGVYTAYGLGANDGSFYFMGNGTFNGRIRNISVKSISGNHAYVTADANRGILRSRFNQITYSEQFDNAAWNKVASYVQTNLLTYSELFENAAWAKNNSFVQTNLLTYSQEFDNAVWSKLSTGTGVVPVVTQNYSVAPDGTTTADRIVFDRGAGTTSSDISYISQAITSVSADCTGSIWLRTTDGSTKTIAFRVGSTFNYTQSVTGTWTRVSLTGTSPVTRVDLLSYGDRQVQVTDLLVWGAQLVQGSVPGDYQATTSAALAVAYANWDGTLTARKLSEDAANTQHSMTQLATVTTDVHNLSFYAKAGERRRFTLRFGNIAPPDNATFDLVSGTVVTSVPASIATISPLANGWYRCSVFSTSSSAGIRSHQLFLNSDSGSGVETYVGDGTSGIYISDSQLVQGSVPGDYRETAASALPILYTNPLGGLTAQALAGDGGNTTHEVRHTITTSGAAIHTVSTYLKQNTERYAYIVMLGRSVTDDNGDAVFLDLQTGTIVSSSGSGIYATLTLINNGWYRVVTPTSSYPASTQIEIRVGVANAPSAQASTASGSIFVWGGQVVPTAVFPTNTYQRIAASTDYATGPAFPLYIQTDGTNDAMLTNTINFANGPSSPPLGPELVTNGDFASATGWSTGGVWAISGGVASITSSTASLSQSTLAAVAGKTYVITFTISAFTAGGVRIEFGGINGTSRTAAGTYTQYFTATSTAFLVVSPVATSTLSIDNISVKEMDSAYAPDKMTVTAGVTKLSDAVQVIDELSANSDSNAGTFYLANVATSTLRHQVAGSPGGATRALGDTTLTNPSTAVVSQQFNIAGASVSTQIVVRQNDALQTLTGTAGTAGTGTFGNYPLYLFARGNASFYFNGYFYGAVVVQKYLSAGELASVTNWMEVRTFGKDMSYSYDYVTLDNGDSVTLDNGDPVYTNIYYS